ncbi:xyloglucan O-acetyltransferase 4-like [Rhododendron vialii]|uniref:xyloglucan O-acetyltransferase 4-like n=1 Tax=Rhododendron vialii TaxID=182163 RepID=UPI00265FB47D|nr:xyloglucan O-acetyltransferase 4-like [Rhododendron vialii]
MCFFATNQISQIVDSNLLSDCHSDWHSSRIIGCNECKGMVTFLWTFSPAHFENGTWDNGGNCNRTWLVLREIQTDQSYKKNRITRIRLKSPPKVYYTWKCNTSKYSDKFKPKKHLRILRITTPLELRRIQVEEIERPKKIGEKSGINLQSLDVTRAMLLRPDGHPGSYWVNKWMKGYDDCVHWCLPGPIDAWNDLLLEMLGREDGLSLG